jgi:hypothetical protein
LDLKMLTETEKTNDHKLGYPINFDFYQVFI